VFEGVVVDECGVVGTCSRAVGQNVAGPAVLDGDSAVVEGGITLEVEAVQLAAYGIGMDPVAEVVEDDVVVDELSGSRRRFLGVAVMSARTTVAVLVEEGAANLVAERTRADQDTLSSIVHDPHTAHLKET
jgi:hypothetical protein